MAGIVAITARLVAGVVQAITFFYRD